jgi:hypothetical protein
MMDRSEYLNDNAVSMQEATEARAIATAYCAAREYRMVKDPDCSWKEAFAKTGNKKYFNKYFQHSL